MGLTRPRFILSGIGAVLGFSTSSDEAYAGSAPVPGASAVIVNWNEVPGATAYELSVDGVVVDTLNRNARSACVDIDDETVVEVVDLPARSLVQEIRCSQGLS